MTEILVLAGALVAIPAGVLVAALCMAGVWTLWERFTETFRVQGEERQWKRLHDRLISDSCWFSEDEPTMRLIQVLAHGGDVSHAREEWRRARLKQEPPR